MRHHSNDQRNPGLERNRHISKQTAWLLLTRWTINTTVFCYSFSHNRADHDIGLQSAIKSRRVSERVLGTVWLCYKPLMCFILSTITPYHIPRVLWNRGRLLGQLGPLRLHVHAVWGDSAWSPWEHGWMNKGREFAKHGGGKVSWPCDVGGSGSNQT